MFVGLPSRRAAALAALIVGLSTLSTVGQMDWQLVAADYPRWRVDHAMAGDTARKRIVLFGGYGYLGDTWQWDGTGWTLRTPAVSPPGRSGHAVAYDAGRQRLVLFGGGSASTLVNDTWEWDGTAWTRLQPAVSPQARYCPALAYDAARRRVVLYGGMAGSGRNSYVLGDTWEWDGVNWVQRSPATSPPACYDHAMTYDPRRQRVVLFATGGFWNASNDTWEWDGITWTRKTPATLPPKRYAHSIEYDPASKRVLLFGGIGGTIASPTTLNDTWLWDGVDWARQQTPVSPPSNAGHEMALDPAGGRLLAFGGYYSHDTWAWTGSTWTKVASAAGKPPVRYAHATADDRARQRVVLFGGWDWSTRFDDTWTWDGTRWTAARPKTKPPARHSHAMTFDPIRKRVVLFGGNGGGVLQDTWEWDGTDWLAVVPSTSPSAREGHGMVYDGARRQVLLFGGFNGAYLNDTWTWDGKNWSRQAPATSPSGRRDHGMAYDAARQRVVLFGGDTGVAAADTWEWDGASWRQLQPSMAPSPRWQHPMAYDAARQRVVLFGGWEFGRIPHSKPTFFTDTWEWDGARWTCQSPASRPPSLGAVQPMTYDSTRGRLILSYAGDLETWAYVPTDLTASAHSVSAATGGSVILSLDAGAAHAGKVYWILGCAEGQGPRGIPSLKVNLLLNPDPYFWFTAHYPNPLIRGALGVLDGSGRATATIRVPPLPPGLVGARFYHAYVVFRSTVDYASTPVPLTLVK